MRRTLIAGLAAGPLLLAGAAACGGDSDDSPPAPDVVAACDEYQRLVNQWGVDYGAEVGAVAQAGAAGDEEREETAVAVVRELFQTTADGLREQSGSTSDEELSEALGEAADGLTDIAGQIETYDDVQAAPELMSEGQFAEGGERVSSLCAN
jgi:hypothetical protein